MRDILPARWYNVGMGKESYNITVAPACKNPVYEQREAGVGHTPYETEKIFYSCIRAGDVHGVMRFFKDCLDAGIVVGSMSRDSLTQMKYFGVCCVTLACRYAIEGGMAEQEAFNFSDDVIRAVDGATCADEIMSLLMEKAVTLAKRVGECSLPQGSPKPVRDAVNYINLHLHEKITLTALAAHCGFSADYLSELFRKSTGTSVSRYVGKRKCEAAKAMLEGRFPVSAVAYNLGFSSESQFIAKFVGEFGVTPARWRRNAARNGDIGGGL